MRKSDQDTFEKAKRIFRNRGGMLNTGEALNAGIPTRMLYEMQRSGILPPLVPLRTSSLREGRPAREAISRGKSSFSLYCVIARPDPDSSTQKMVFGDSLLEVNLMIKELRL